MKYFLKEIIFCCVNCTDYFYTFNSFISVSKMETKEDVQKYFCKTVEENPELSVGVAAIRTLMEIIRQYKFETIRGLDDKMQESIDVMKNSNYPVAAIISGCELFLRFVTLCVLDTKSIEECKQNMLNRGQLFLEKLDQCRDKIVKLAVRYIGLESKILVHSRSRVVLHTIKEAASRNMSRLQVFVTISPSDNSGETMCKELEADGINCTPIFTSAVGYIMEQVDFVFVGAEAVCESGGIINKLGTFTLAVCAKELRKPLYVLAESFKFSKVFPLNQRTLSDEYKYTSEVRKNCDLKKEHPMVDYTPPDYINLLFTDLGLLQPAAVNDEIIKMYL